MYNKFFFLFICRMDESKIFELFVFDVGVLK